MSHIAHLCSSFETESKGSWHPGGFTTSWANDHYNEYLVSYGNQRIGQFTELLRDDDDDDNNTTTASSWFSSYVHLEFSTPTDTHGFTASTVLEWSFNATSDPRLIEMAENLGKELTGTTCDEKYAEVWSALKNTTLNSSSSSSSSPVSTTSERGMITTTLVIMIITTASSLFFMVT